MIKKITRIILCIVSFAGLSLIAFTATVTFPKISFFYNLTAAGLGLSNNKNDTHFTLSPSTDLPPYAYINLPKDVRPPGAFAYYDSFPVDPPPAIGQDPAPPPENNVTLPENTFPVIALDMSEGQKVNGLIYKNESKYTPDINVLSQADYPLSYANTASNPSVSQPLVLIIHTHGTECYLPDGQDTYTVDTPTRSQNTDINVVAVGRALAEELNKNGVSAIHCDTMFDSESYSDSYDLSEKAVLEYLAKYPSIQYVFDVHRDSIIRENNEKVKPLTVINGIPTAQAMFVVGTDSLGAPHPNWIDNLTVASIFQCKLIDNYGNLMRPINLRSASFNAEHAKGSILIEVGTCGNTVTEAVNCGRLLGQTISDVILTDGKS